MGQLGVQIGLAKSLVSPRGVCEFAKRFFTPADSSPISLKEVAVAQSSVGNLVELVRKRADSFPVTFANVFAFLGYGYRVRGSINTRFSKLSNRTRNWLLVLTFPGSPFGVTMDEWVSQRAIGSYSDRELEPGYRSLIGVLTERLHSRLRSLQPRITRAWDIKLLPRNLKLGRLFIPE